MTGHHTRANCYDIGQKSQTTLNTETEDKGDSPVQRQGINLILYPIFCTVKIPHRLTGTSNLKKKKIKK